MDKLYHTSMLFFFVFFFFFNQKKKNNAVLEPNTGHFRGLEGFEAKDLSFVARAKDFKTYPRGRP